MKVATANIKNLPDMPRPFVRDDAAGVRRVADVCGFQELGEVEDHEDVLTALGPDWLLERGGLSVAGCDNPIGYDTREWTLVDSGHVLLHEGMEGVSYNRFLVWADLRRVDRPRAVLRFANGHFVAHVFGRDNATRPDHLLRVRTWEQDYQVTEQFIRDTIGAGLPVVLVGDMNRRDFKPPAGGTLAYGPSIEKITTHPAAGAEFVVRETGDVHGHSDHPVRWARIYLDLPDPEPVPHDCPTCGLSHLPPAPAS